MLVLVPAPANAMVVFSDSLVGMASYTVTQTGHYRIDAYGAATGLQVNEWLGNSWQGGSGIGIGGDFYLTAGQVLAIDVGGAGLGYGFDSLVSQAGMLMMDAPGGDGGTSGLGIAVDTGANPTYLPSLPNLPQQVVDLFPGDPGLGGTDGPFVVVGPSTPGSITIAAVPEPSSWVMMLTGFGALGLIARRRRLLTPLFRQPAVR